MDVDKQFLGLQTLECMMNKYQIIQFSIDISILRSTISFHVVALPLTGS